MKTILKLMALPLVALMCGCSDDAPQGGQEPTPEPVPSPLIYRYIMDFLVDFAYKLIENPYFLDFLPVCGCWF